MDELLRSLRSRLVPPRPGHLLLRDRHQKHQGAWTYPWKVFGSNAIFAYAFAELLSIVLEVIQIGSHGTTMSLKEVDLCQNLLSHRRSIVRFTALLPVFRSGLLYPVLGVIPKDESSSKI